MFSPWPIPALDSGGSKIKCSVYHIIREAGIGRGVAIIHILLFYLGRFNEFCCLFICISDHPPPHELLFFFTILETDIVIFCGPCGKKPYKCIIQTPLVFVHVIYFFVGQ